MYVEPAAPVAPEGHELIRGYLITRQRQWHDEALAVDRIEELASIGVVVGAPDERAFAALARAVRGGLLRPIAPAEKITVPYRVVARVQRLAPPGKLENAFRDAPLVAGVRIDGAAPLRRPGHDLDCKSLRVFDQAAVPPEDCVGSCQEWRLLHAPRAGGGRVGNVVQINFHELPAESAGRRGLCAARSRQCLDHAGVVVHGRGLQSRDFSLVVPATHAYRLAVIR